MPNQDGLEAGKSQRAPCTDFGEISGFNFDIVGDIASGCRAYAGRDIRVVVDGERQGAGLRIQRIETSGSRDIGSGCVDPVAVLVGKPYAIDDDVGSELAIWLQHFSACSP